MGLQYFPLILTLMEMHIKYMVILEVGHILLLSKDQNILINLLRANPTKWSSTLKQFIGSCQQIFGVCLTVLGGCRFKG